MRTKSVFVIFLLSGLSLLGQTLGEITGTVTDPSGAAVPSAVITLTSTSTNAVRTTNSNEQGLYTFPSVAPGIYDVKVEHPGFKSTTSNKVEVQVQQSLRLDLTLQVGQVSESVEVSASAALLQAENATVGSVVETKSIVELPLNGREYLNLVTLAPNVSNLAPPSGQAQSRQGADRANLAISAGGNRIVYDYYTLDGVVNTDPNFNTYIVLPSIDAIQEFKVQTGVYPAEFGHEATQINVLTKSGGNAYHGSLFEFVRNNDFDALPYQFTTTKPGVSPFKWNDFGFELDGPVVIPKLFNGRNKLFFMANDEWLIQRNTQQAVYNVPTPQMFQGNFSQPGLPTIYDPSTKQPFQGNMIPSSMISPISQKLLQYYDAANIPGTLTNNYVQNNAYPFDRDGFVLRMDFVESAKSQWTGRYSWGDEVQSNQTINVSGAKITTNYEQYLGSNTRTFTPNLVNEARFGYARFFNAITALGAFSTNYVQQLALPNLPPGPPVTWGIPSVGLSGYSGFGDNSDGPYQNDTNTAQFMDNISWIKGKHTFKFGFEYDRQNYNEFGNQYSRGQYSFQPNATQSATHTGGDSFAEFLLGTSFQDTVAVAAANVLFHRNNEAVFADDTWKVTPKLTLSLGLRWELVPPFTDSLNNLFIVYVPHNDFAPQQPQSRWPYFVRQGNCTDAYNANPPISVRWTKTPAVCSNGLLPYQLMDTRYTDFAPRFGIAYSPDAKTVIRAGFGIFFSQDNANSPYFDLGRNLAVRNSNIATTGQADLNYSNAFPATGGSTVPVGAPYAYSDNPAHHTAYTEQYMLNIQRQFGASWAVEVGYLGSQSHHMAGFWNQNQGVPSPVGTAASHLPFGDYTFIQTVEDMGNAEYNSLAVKVDKRFSAGFSLTTAYTYGVAIDDTSAIRIQGYDTLFPQNSDCVRCERGPSSFDTRHRLVVSPLYELPIGKGKALNIENRFADAIIGGWQVGGILTAQAGVPASLNIGGRDNSNTQTTYDRPDYVSGQSVAAANQSASRWWNNAAFVEAPFGSFGDVGRDSALAPGVFSINAEVHKNFRMPYKEGHQVQFRAEAFNVLNHPNFYAPNQNILAGAAFPGAPANAAHQGFGVINQLAFGIPMRQLQLGLKYTF